VKASLEFACAALGITLSFVSLALGRIPEGLALCGLGVSWLAMYRVTTHMELNRHEPN
jgi:hypothetical protein